MRKSIVSRVVAIGLGALVLAGLACTPVEEKPDPEVTKAAWIYVGPPGDLGWTYAHNQGRLAAEQALENLTTSYVENVATEDAEQELQKLVDAGNKVIFTTSFDYMDPTLAAAEANPEVTFEHCSGYKTADNMGNYFGRMYQARYLTGVVAAHMTTSKKIGIAGAVPIPEVVRHVNAIARGARSVDPSIEIHIQWVNAWYDPSAAELVSNSLIDAGCDVIFQDTDSATPVTVAESRGVYAIGYNSDVLSFASDTVLTSAVWNWGDYYARRIKAVEDKTWTSESYWGGIDSGIVGLGAWGDMVPQTVKDAVETARAGLAAGSFDVFDGPFNHRDGSAWVASGATMSDADMLNMYDFVEGVVGDDLP